MSEPSPTPKKPCRLALWIDQCGEPDQLKVDYVPTGCDTAETRITLTVRRSKTSFEVGSHELLDQSYADCEVELHLGHCSIVRLTDLGRKRVEAWKVFQKKEARDIAEFKRLQKKFGGVTP